MTTTKVLKRRPAMTLVRDRNPLWWCLLLATWLTSLLTPALASAEVRLDGSWPDADQPVSLRADQVSRQQALQLLSEAAGWSIVAQGLTDDRIDLSVRDQPAAKVLDMILSGNDYVAAREGERVTIGLDNALVAPAAPSVPPAPVKPVDDSASDQDRDRTVFGGNLRIEKGERVEDVVVLGGHVDVWGVVEGDLEVMGGEARLHEGSHVLGDVSALGGSLHMDDHARIDGDVEVLGGAVHRARGAIIGGAVSGNGTDHDVASAAFVPPPAEDWSFARMMDDATSAMTRTLLLFVFGAIFWALGRERLESLEVEIAKRPMKSLALGVVGAISAALMAIALVVTVVGIPFAVAGSLLTILVAYVGACVVLSTIGQAFLRHRTENRYVHLGLGCLLFLLFTAIPYVGTFVWLGVLLTGLGAVVATRGAGLLPASRPRADHGPYRTAAI